jgi:hypothetical protein
MSGAMRWMLTIAQDYIRDTGDESFPTSVFDRIHRPKR